MAPRRPPPAAPLFVALLCVLVASACSAADDAKPQDTGGAADTNGIADADGSTGAGSDAVAVDTTNVDTTPGDTTGEDAIAPGAIGWPCKTPTDCKEPFCLDTPDGKRCSTYCGGASCPSGWACAGQLSGGDATTFCVAAHGLLCRPCDTDAACQTSGLAGSRCVRYGDDGGFCGAPCGGDTDCPSGLACRAVKTKAGSSAKQCVVPGENGGSGESFGSCACSAAASTTFASTTCSAATPGGLTPYACQPNPGKTKVCDASLDTACSKNACVPLSGTCTPTATERTVTLCDLPPAAGSTEPGCRIEVLPPSAPSAPAATCDDGLPCSKGDTCADGLCTTTDTSGCGCQGDADCTDDGDLCNGVPYCDKSGSTWSCKTNPATVVSCDTTSDGACEQTSCEPQTGSCSKAGKPAGTACDDGVACTTGDICDGKGGCTPGTWTCCKSDADCAGQEDGDFCNGTLFCNLQSGACELNPKTVVSCPTVDDTSCRKNVCDKDKGVCGLVDLPAGVTCDADGTACTAGDGCDGKGGCAVGEAVCGCQSDADCAGKDDGTSATARSFATNPGNKRRARSTRRRW